MFAVIFTQDIYLLFTYCLPMMSQTFKTLAMDTTAPEGHAALLEGAHTRARERFRGPEGHVVLLAQTVSRMLTTQGWSCADLDLLVVTTGPGSFAGVRIALAYAEGMALAQHIPLVGLSTLDLIAAGTGHRQGWVAVVLDARRGEVFTSLYRLEKGLPTPYRQPGMAVAPAQWASTLATMPELSHATVHMTGSGLGPYGVLFHEALGARFSAADASCWEADPGLLGQLGHALLTDASRDMAAPPLEAGRGYLAPWIQYQRRPDAEEQKYGRSCTPAS